MNISDKTEINKYEAKERSFDINLERTQKTDRQSFPVRSRYKGQIGNEVL